MKNIEKFFALTFSLLFISDFSLLGIFLILLSLVSIIRCGWKFNQLKCKYILHVSARPEWIRFHVLRSCRAFFFFFFFIIFLRVCRIFIFFFSPFISFRPVSMNLIRHLGLRMYILHVKLFPLHFQPAVEPMATIEIDCYIYSPKWPSNNYQIKLLLTFYFVPPICQVYGAIRNDIY